MPEPLSAEEVAARLAETLALCGWEGVRVAQGRLNEDDHLRPTLVFTAAPLLPVQPVVSPYGAASSLTGARQRVRDRSRVIGAVLAQQARERALEEQHEVAAVGRSLDDIVGEVDFDADYQGGNS